MLVSWDRGCIYGVLKKSISVIRQYVHTTLTEKID